MESQDPEATMRALAGCTGVTRENGFWAFAGTGIKAHFPAKPDPHRVALSVALKHGLRGVPLAMSIPGLPTHSLKPLVHLPAVLVNALRVGRRDPQGVVAAFICDWVRSGAPRAVITALEQATNRVWRCLHPSPRTASPIAHAPPAFRRPAANGRRSG